jgi:hypothetical protein
MHYHDGMIRAQIQFTEKQAEALRLRARREKVSVAELVRRAIDAFMRAEPPTTGELRARAIRAAGQFASGGHDTSSRHGEALIDAFQAP